MKILIAEDDRASRIMLNSMLSKWGYEVVAVDDGSQAREVLLEEDPPQLAILDWMMPAPDGVELCRLVRNKESPNVSDDHEENAYFQANPRYYIYIILLSAKAQREDMIQGLDAGADDYITKPFNAEELQARIRAGLRIVDLQNQLINTQKRLQHLARIDYLTGIFNRRAIIERLKQEMARSTREKAPLSLAILDIDHFKRVNDTLGHHTGDGVLVECVRRMQELLREYDILGRFGGEEFLLIIPGTNEHQSLEICERIRQRIGERSMDIECHSVTVTMSMGLTTWRQEISLDDLITKVDDALYRAKGCGRNQIATAEIA